MDDVETVCTSATGGPRVSAEAARARSSPRRTARRGIALLGSAWVDVALIGLAAIVCYANSFGAPFVFDGIAMIPENPVIRQLWPPWPVLTFTMRPVSFYSFALNYAVCGTTVWGYHAVNLAIHIAAAVVLYATIRRTLSATWLSRRYGPSARPIALVASLVWLVHPLQTQSVTYVYQRMESLMGLFFLLTLYCFARAQRRLGLESRL